MDARNHKEYSIENNTLKNTCKAVDTIIKNPRLDNLGGGDNWANFSLLQHNLDKIEMMKKYLNEPYIGRIDFQTDEKNTYYIGRIGFQFDGIQIIDWRAPISSLFYSGNSYHQNYLAPDGKISGSLLLRRSYTIQRRDLIDITDTLDYRDGFLEEADDKKRQEQLITEVQQRGDPSMQDIVKTIQAEQDEIIRAPRDKTIIIDGVAGSGKTSIAFHRLAFLLFPGHKNNILPESCIVFCPNKIFLQFIENLLPGLGVQKVQQTTFADWAFGQMNINDYGYTDTPLAKFTTQKIGKDVLRSIWKRSYLKGQLKFEDLINNYVDYLRKSIQFPKEGLILESSVEENLKIEINFDYLKKYQDDIDNANTPLNLLRQVIQVDLRKYVRSSIDPVLEKMIETLENDAKKQAAEALDCSTDEEILMFVKRGQSVKSKVEKYKKYLNIPNQKEKLLSDFNYSLNEELEKIINKFHVVPLYYELIHNRELLKKINHNVLTSEDLFSITQTEFDGYHIELEDLPAIFILYQSLNGVSNHKYQHIVIDEVQDCSPLMIKIIDQFSDHHSLTLVGDLSQPIHAYRGINNWKLIESIFESEHFEIIEVNQNYRNTKQIVEFTNHVLSKIQQRVSKPLPKSLDRSGPKPQLEVVSDQNELISKIVQEIRTIIEDYKYNNIALITKSRNESETLYLKLDSESPELKADILNDDSKYLGGIVCLPVELAKGLEFEAAIIVDASDDRYKTNVQYDGQLLYVAITRALHYLSVFSVGKLSNYFK